MTGLAILDLGYGNTRSVALAFDRLGAVPVLTSDPQVAERAERLVLPGVGAAGTAMRRLNETGLAAVVRSRVRPTLGICLGMQLLFGRSAEDGGIDLLGIIPGQVMPLVPDVGFPVPHMGWSQLDVAGRDIGVRSGDHVYFAHSFACPDGRHTSARVRYGEAIVPAAVRFGPFWGAQFHPERSSASGVRFLEAFLKS